MRERIQHIGLFVKSALFTTIIHSILLAALFFGQWQFSEKSIKRGTTKPIQAQVISTDYIQQKKATKLAQEQKQVATEKKRKAEAEKKKQVADEKKRKVEAEKKKQVADEKKRKAEVEKKKQVAAEKKRKAEAEEQKRLAAEKRKREQALKDKLEKERILQQQAQTKLDAATALNELVDRITIAVQNNWRRPLNSKIGLEVTFIVKVSQNGDVLSANVVKSSGDRFFDQSAELAVKKASPLPFPANPKYYEFINVFNLKFKPDDS